MQLFKKNLTKPINYLWKIYHLLLKKLTDENEPKTLFLSQFISRKAVPYILSKAIHHRQPITLAYRQHIANRQNTYF